MSAEQDAFLPTMDLPLVNLQAEDLWTAWRDACEDLRDAHRAWCEVSRGDGADAYVVLVAAADREASAADALWRHCRSEAS